MTIPVAIAMSSPLIRIAIEAGLDTKPVHQRDERDERAERERREQRGREIQ